ncbi:MAG: hypothetical protein IPN69_04260 [Acidobacteria bacterium]|nr:hypothetical protein [Acidobacteriota bacterium]
MRFSFYEILEFGGAAAEVNGAAGKSRAFPHIRAASRKEENFEFSEVKGKNNRVQAILLLYD